MTGPPAARLTIGLSPLAGVAATLALTALRQSMPRLEVIVQVAGRESIAAETAAGNLDAGIVDGLAAPGDPLALSEASPLTATGIAEEPVVVPLPPGHPLASRTQLSLEELADARWIDAPDVAVPLPGIRQATATEGFRAAIRYDGTDLHTLLLLTGQGHGLTLLPLSALAPTAAAALAAAPLDGGPCHLTQAGLPRGAAAWIPAPAVTGCRPRPHRQHALDPEHLGSAWAHRL